MDFCKSHNGTQTNKISAECNLQICMPQSACSEYYVVEDAADYSDLAYFAHLLWINHNWDITCTVSANLILSNYTVVLHPPKSRSDL